VKTLITLLFLSLNLPIGLKAQKESSLVADWKSHSFPSGRDTLLSYSHSGDYRVYIQDNQVKVEEGINGKKNDLPFEIESRKPEKNQEFYRPFAGTRTVLQLDDGYLVGFNNGEFGGSLNWFSADGKANYLIARPNLQQFIQRDGKIYAIEGLFHMSLNLGSILQIEKKGEKWSASNYLSLPSAPRAITVNNNKHFLIASASALLSIDDKLNITTLYSNTNWLYYLSPNSIVYHNNTVYVGMRGGVFKYQLNTKKQDWLQPDQ